MHWKNNIYEQSLVPSSIMNNHIMRVYANVHRCNVYIYARPKKALPFWWLMLNAVHTYRLAISPTADWESAFVGRCVPNADPIVGAILPIQIFNRRSSQSAVVGRFAPNVDPIVGINRRVHWFLDQTRLSVVNWPITELYHFQLLTGLPWIVVIFASLFPSKLV